MMELLLHCVSLLLARLGRAGQPPSRPLLGAHLPRPFILGEAVRDPSRQRSVQRSGQDNC